MQASNPDLVEQLRYDDDDNDANDNDDDAQAADAGRTRGAIPATRGRTAPVTSLSGLVRGTFYHLQVLLCRLYFGKIIPNIQ